jgi:uncharacterized protein (DUF58 family)
MPAPRSSSPEQILRRLEWTVLRRLDGLLQGDYRTLFRGFGMDLADLREYQYHDDVRHIDWNVTARLQTPYVREYREDRELAAWFLLDLSGSVDFGSGATKKQAVAVDFVALLARVLTRRGNRVGALLFDGKRIGAIVPPRSGRRHVLELLQRMQTGVGPGAGETDLAELLTAAANLVRRRSLVFAVSDFLSVAGWEQPLARLAQRHEVIAIRLFDALEMALPDLGLVLLQDAETGEQIAVDTHDPAFRRRFAAAAHARETRLREAFAAAGVDALELAAGGDLVDAVLRFADLRKRRGSGASGAAARSRLAAHLESRAIPVSGRAAGAVR